jgi:hypothetical protein
MDTIPTLILALTAIGVIIYCLIYIRMAIKEKRIKLLYTEMKSVTKKDNPIRFYFLLVVIGILILLSIGILLSLIFM